MEQRLPETGPITLTFQLATDVSGLKAYRLRALVRAGDIEAVRVGRERLIVFESLRRYLMARIEKNPKPTPEHSAEMRRRRAVREVKRRARDAEAPR
jgi:hypothetical protein